MAPCVRGGGVDRINGLPDDLLLRVLVLARLRCARAAARTSLISRRWRGLWRHLPELSFRDISPGALDAALAQVARTELSLLDINVPRERHLFSPARLGSLRAAELRLVVWGNTEDRWTAVEVPCFHRAASVKLGGWWLAVALPEQGAVFPVVERLSIAAFCFDFGDLIPRCPRLRHLEASRVHGIGAVTVHSPTIESLHVLDGMSPGWGMSIDVVAPRLKKFTLSGNYIINDLSVSFSAPVAEDVDLSVRFSLWRVPMGCMWGMSRFNLDQV